MKILVGSYLNNIYEINLDLKNNIFLNSNILIEATKPSYLINYKELSYIHTINDIQFINIGNEDVKLGEGACHLSYDNKFKSIYTSFYGAGLLKILNQVNDKFEVTQTIKYTNHSHIHYAELIETIGLVGVVDLGDNKFYLYENINGKLVEKTYYQFKKEEGPRHFVYHKTKPLIYIINEHKPSVTVLSYENNVLEFVNDYPLTSGAGSAIRITDDQKYLYAAVRFSNYLFAFKINDDGSLYLIQKISTKGDHPRDFNLINNDKHLVLANMNSDNLMLYKIIDGKLYLKDTLENIVKGASIMTKS